MSSNGGSDTFVFRARPNAFFFNASFKHPSLGHIYAPLPGSRPSTSTSSSPSGPFASLTRDDLSWTDLQPRQVLSGITLLAGYRVKDAVNGLLAEALDLGKLFGGRAGEAIRAGIARRGQYYRGLMGYAEAP